MRDDCTTGIEMYGRHGGAHSMMCIDVPPSLARPGLFGD
jgi:hypothetical protein